ncbi:MAG: AIR synthase-related protein [Spirochaetes bacterium]|nr:AIR synthase-related protein [Spirochaetota bacterium]
MRTEIYYKNPQLDGRAKRLLEQLKQSVSPLINNVKIVDVYITHGIDQLTPELAKKLFSDTVAQKPSIHTPAAFKKELADAEWRYLFEVAYKPGVTNPAVITLKSVIEAEIGKKICDADVILQTAMQYLIESPALEKNIVEKLKRVFFNPVVQVLEFRDGGLDALENHPLPTVYPYKVVQSNAVIEKIPIHQMAEKELKEISEKKFLALSLDEMNAIKNYFADENTARARLEAGIGQDATDAELEMIAQTWSEHCKHKIFQATIEYKDNETGETENIKSVFSTYIKKATKELSEKRPFLKSVFHDNSGVIDFDDENLVCFKVETHNSPSALDPYGGAITGVLGVNRDIMGTGKGARPFFNTNVLCVGEVETHESKIPEGLFHPRTILKGAHQGVKDGGNQSGIPTVAGALLFDESFIGKPLVFCGTGGILPYKIAGEGSWIKHIDAGDFAVMAGGRVGKDGIHGATLSSQAMEEGTPAAVVMGDPMTQKIMLDFLLEARDAGLYKGITDNGAGGISSSLGEMAEYCGGVRIDLHKCPLKYDGLAPWEILVSESQERMSLAVSPDKIEEFLELAKKRGVEATVVGEFTNSGFVDIRFGNERAGLLSLEFLHRGNPEMRLKAEWQRPETADIPLPELDCNVILKTLLNESNIASKEVFVRQYDHEAGAGSVVKPFTGKNSDAPSDGAVIRPVLTSKRGITVTHGICPRYGDRDTYNMAACAVDEAFRAHIAQGGNPEYAAILDNFCWPDPIESESTPDGKYKLAQLVRACKGLYDAAIGYSLPLISGKDSMKNDAKIDGKKVSVRPTLLISLIGIIDNFEKAVTTDFKDEGDFIYIIGNTNGELGGTSLEKLARMNLGKAPMPDINNAFKLYTALSKAISRGLVKSCHDISDGGIAIALAESCLGGDLGADISIDMLPGTDKNTETARILFCETPSRFIATIKPDNIKEFEDIMHGYSVCKIGSTTKDPVLKITRDRNYVVDMPVSKIAEAWKREDF